MTEKRFRRGKGLFIDYPSEAIIDETTGERYYDGIKPNYASSKEICDLLNALHEENQELRQDNDIKFWKLQFRAQHNCTQLILHELSLAMNEGYEVSDKFKEWLDDLTEKNKEVITKHERLFE